MHLQDNMFQVRDVAPVTLKTHAYTRLPKYLYRDFGTLTRVPPLVVFILHCQRANGV